MFCIPPIIKFKLDENYKREYLFSSIWLVILVYRITTKL